MKTRTVTHTTLGRGQPIPSPVTGRYLRMLDNGRLSRFVEVIFEGETEPRRIVERYLSFSMRKWNFPSLQVRLHTKALAVSNNRTQSHHRVTYRRGVVRDSERS
jgi:hypothetical protein